MSGTTLDFQYFPANTWRPSGFFAEFNSSLANTATPTNRALIIGQMTASGTGPANVPVLAVGQAAVTALAGAGSMLALEYADYRGQDPYGEVWVVPVADNAAGTAATGAITITGTATAPGAIQFYVGGVNIPVGVNLGDTANVVATALAAAVNSGQYLTGCTAGTVTAGAVPLTAVHKGAAQNDIDLRVNYRGAQAGEVIPPGLSVAFTAFSGGATNPVLTTALANLNVTSFDFIACPYTDATSLAALASFLSDQTGRWSAISMLYGHVFAAFKGTVGARQTFGISNNNQHMTIISNTNSPTPVWRTCADLAGAHAVIIRTNPARGVNGQPLQMLPPAVTDRDSPTVINTMLYSGLSTFDVVAGVCVIDRSITTYQTNTAGQPDNSYLNTNMMFQGMYAARYLKAQLQSQFFGKILVTDGTPIGVGSPATTPSLVFKAACGVYAYLCSQFICQNPQKFAQVGYGASGQKGQVLLYLPIDFSDQVIQIAALIQFVQST